MSLTHPPIRQFLPEFYRIHHADPIPEGGGGSTLIPPGRPLVLHLCRRGGTPESSLFKASQLKDCEMLERVDMGMANHLDWFIFISTIWRALDHAQLVDEIKSELDGLLASSLVVVNQTADVFARLLASNATVRREGIFDSSVLNRTSELLIRGQPIGGADLLGGRCAELVQLAAEDTQKSLLFQAAVGHAGKPKEMGKSRGSSLTHRRNRPPKKSRRAPTPSLPGQRPQFGPPISRRV